MLTLALVYPGVAVAKEVVWILYLSKGQWFNPNSSGVHVEFSSCKIFADF